jgi:hypothetical protein
MLRNLVLAGIFLGTVTQAQAAVELSCVCMRYARVAGHSEVTGSESVQAVVTTLFRTTQMARARGCNEHLSSIERAREVEPAQHFNCRVVALEDMPLER